MFNVYSRFHGDNSFQAGTYDLHKNLGVQDAVNALEGRPRINYVDAHGPARPVAQQIAARVGNLPGRPRDPFLQGTRNNAVRSIFEPPGVSNLEGLAAARHLQGLELAGRDRDPPDDGAARSTRTRRSSGSTARASTGTPPTR